MTYRDAVIRYIEEKKMDGEEILQTYDEIIIEFDMEEAQIEKQLGTPETFVDQYFEDREDQLKISRKSLHERLKRKKRYKVKHENIVGYIVYVMILTSFWFFVKGIINQEGNIYWGDGISNFVWPYILYELITSLTGIYLTSHQKALRLREIMRYYFFGGFFISLLFREFYTKFDPSFNYARQFYFNIVYLELLIIFSAAMPGLSSLGRDQFKDFKLNIGGYILILLSAIVVFTIFSYAIYWTITVLLIINSILLILNFFKIIRFSEELILFIGIAGVMSTFMYVDSSYPHPIALQGEAFLWSYSIIVFFISMWYRVHLKNKRAQ